MGHQMAQEQLYRAEQLLLWPCCAPCVLTAGWFLVRERKSGHFLQRLCDESQSTALGDSQKSCSQSQITC